jgi:hypothetical protein
MPSRNLQAGDGVYVYGTVIEPCSDAISIQFGDNRWKVTQHVPVSCVTISVPKGVVGVGDEQFSATSALQQTVKLLREENEELRARLLGAQTLAEAV